MISPTSGAPTVGIFVGGKASRMGGKAKGLLPAPDGSGTLVARLHGVCTTTLPGCSVYLVGDHAAYRDVRLPTLSDDPAGIGPLGGLRALLSTALAEDSDAIAIACDLPTVSASMLLQLVREHRDSAALAPRAAGTWQPLFARYRPAVILPRTAELLQTGRYAMHRLFDAEPTARELSLDATSHRLLDDWDTDDDVRRSSVPPPKTPA